MILIKANPSIRPLIRCGCALLVCLVSSGFAAAVDLVEFEQNGQRHIVTGKVVVKAQDGGLLLVGQDNQMWAVQPGEFTSQASDDAPFKPLNHEELGLEVLKELPGLRLYTTAHYVICYNTTKAYAQWCGSLYERLYRAFYNYWQRRGIDLDEAPPLVALVFQDRASYEKYGGDEMGGAVKSVIGYYSLRTNRIAMYDLTGVDDLRQSGQQIRSAAHVNRVLSQPRAERTVATIIHEATHQLAFNSGLQSRFADIPVWLSEGIAIYFETPDLTSRKGWRTIGGVNRVRFQQFRQYLPQRPEDSLSTLLSTDARFRDATSASAAYAECWALCYYLIRNHPEEFAEYLKLLRQKKPMVNMSTQQRVEEFCSVFGDLNQLDTDFLRQMRKVN